MDWSLTADQRRWRDTARAYATEVVAPAAPRLDAERDPEKGFSWELVDAASEYGLRLAPLPPAFGGGGTDFLTNAVMLEEIAAADLGTSVVLAQTWKFAQLLMELGTADQHERWLRRLVENRRGLMAASLTEPNGGSDNVLPYAGVDGGMQMRAERVAGGWVLNGEKCYISNSNRADSIIAFARTDPGQPVRSGVTMFIVPADSPQVSFGDVCDKLGERTANNAAIFYQNVFVPDEDLLGRENEGLADVARLLRGSNAYAAACTLGVARTAFSRALRYTAERVQGGRRVIEHDDIGVQFAEMYSQLESARTYVFRAAWAADHAKLFDPKMAAMPKLLASQVAFDVTRASLEMFGGSGVMRETGMEKLMRDATIFLHSDGTNTVMRKKIAADLRARVDGNGALDALWDW
ncbi:MAG TPA: acyl-CoA dehydrogenase family protein [Acidimicrobiia bacterium]|nr:acyl-CoA dehydrogenase family protein [Acidimicrobiia bacterium]